MMDKQIQGMQRLISDVFTKIQRLQITATKTNTNIVSECLQKLQIVFNTLGNMIEEKEQLENVVPMKQTEEAENGEH